MSRNPALTALFEQLSNHIELAREARRQVNDLSFFGMPEEIDRILSTLDELADISNEALALNLELNLEAVEKILPSATPDNEGAKNLEAELLRIKYTLEKLGKAAHEAGIAEADSGRFAPPAEAKIPREAALGALEEISKHLEETNTRLDELKEIGKDSSADIRQTGLINLYLRDIRLPVWEGVSEAGKAIVDLLPLGKILYLLQSRTASLLETTKSAFAKITEGFKSVTASLNLEVRGAGGSFIKLKASFKGKGKADGRVDKKKAAATPPTAPPAPSAKELAAAIEEAKELFMEITKGAQEGDWGRVDAALARLDNLRQSFADNAEIALEEAMAAVNVIADAGEAGDWERVDEMLDRIDNLRQSFADNAEIAVLEANAAFNVSNHAGAAGNWGRVDAALARLNNLRQSFAKNAEIAVLEAEAAFNVSNHAGAAGDWGRVDAALARLNNLRQSFADNAEIALEEAKAAVNVTSRAGAAGDWGRVEAMLARLDNLRQSFADNAEIAVEEANAAFNITGHAGAAGDWGRVDAALARLDGLCEKFGENPEFIMPLNQAFQQAVNMDPADWLAEQKEMLAQNYP